jgi:hypothetical protein
MLLLYTIEHNKQGQPCGATHSSAADIDDIRGVSLLECQQHQDSSSGSIRCIGPLDDDIRNSITSITATAADGGSVYGDDVEDSNTEVTLHYHCFHYYDSCCCYYE